MKSMIATGFVALALLTGCGGSESDAKTPSHASTWPTPLQNTTCKQWVNKMSQGQNRSVAADFLKQAWATDNVTDRKPPSTLVSKFKTAIDAQCEAAPEAGIAVAAATVYVQEKATFKP